MDVGCCSGRTSRELASIGCKMIGIDLNIDELSLGRRLNKKQEVHYIQAFGEQLPFRSGVFDGAVLLGVLGAVDKSTREQILQDTMRCLKPKALAYVAEFCFITDKNLYTTTGKKWADVYNQDVSITGEYGSVIVKNSDGLPMFIGHHFREDEFLNLLANSGVTTVGIERVQVHSKVSGSIRDNWNAWGYKN